MSKDIKKVAAVAAPIVGTYFGGPIGAAIGTSVGANLSEKKEAPPGSAPAATGAAVMPDADSMAVAAAKRRKLIAMKTRGGRDSTVLGGEDLLGG